MNTLKEFHDFIDKGYRTYIPHVSLDCAIFGYHDHQLKILLSRLEGVDGLCFPGGYIQRKESLDEAAGRIVREKTGITGIYLQQFKTFGDPDRIKWNETDIDRISNNPYYKNIRNSWLMDQTISVGYYALTDFSLVKPRAGFLTVSCSWYDMQTIPHLLFDHDQMLKEALLTLRLQLYNFPIAEKLLPKKFTLTEVHSVYEALLGKNLDIRNFSKKLVLLELISRLPEKRNIGPHRAPYLYRFNRKNYNRALRLGIALS